MTFTSFTIAFIHHAVVLLLSTGGSSLWLLSRFQSLPTNCCYILNEVFLLNLLIIVIDHYSIINHWHHLIELLLVFSLLLLDHALLSQLVQKGVACALSKHLVQRWCVVTWSRCRVWKGSIVKVLIGVAGITRVEECVAYLGCWGIVGVCGFILRLLLLEDWRLEGRIRLWERRFGFWQLPSGFCPCALLDELCVPLRPMLITTVVCHFVFC